MPRNAAVIQAAGKGSRFHSEQYKLLVKIDGIPLIRRTLAPVLESGFDDVVVVIGAHADEMRKCLADMPVKIIENKNWEEGQSTSLKIGLSAVQDNSDRVCLLLGDQPFLLAETLKKLLAASEDDPENVIVPEYEHKRGNPIVVPVKYYDLLRTFSEGDKGGKKLLEEVGYVPIAVMDPGVLWDIDSVEELRKYEQ